MKKNKILISWSTGKDSAQGLLSVRGSISSKVIFISRNNRSDV